MAHGQSTNTTGTETGPIDAPGSRSIERSLSTLLIAGIISSAVVIFIGAVSVLSTFPADATVDYSRFAAADHTAYSLAAVGSAALRLEPRAIAMIGVLLLVATPIARVAFSLVAFAVQRDRLYSVITLTVLAVLAYSLFFGGV